MRTRQVGLVLCALVAPALVAAEDATDKGDKKAARKISAAKLQTRVREKILDGEPDLVARLLSYEEVRQALEGAPKTAHAVARVVCDNARLIGLKWRGDKPTMKALCANLQAAAERTLTAHPRSSDAEAAMALALGATGRVFESMGAPGPFSNWENAANHATRAADMDETHRADHLLRATRFLREGAPSANQGEHRALRQALKYIQAAREAQAKDPILRREHAYVHLAMARFAVRMEQEARAREAYGEALDLVELPKGKEADAVAADRGAYNRVVAFGHQHNLMRANEGFLATPAKNTSWWDFAYPDGRGWVFKLAMNEQAVFKVTKAGEAGNRVEVVMRRYEHRRDYGVTKTGGDNVGGITRHLLGQWRRKFKLSDDARVSAAGVPGFLAKAKSWALVGEMDEGRARIHAWVFRGKETPNTWALEVLEQGTFHRRINAEALYILKSLKERPQK